jgi:hypothetical protein
MTDPVFANAAITAASSLLFQNSTKSLSRNIQEASTQPLTLMQESVIVGTFGVMIAVLICASIVVLCSIFDSFR